MSKLKTIFMGTPDFAVPCLEVLQAKTEVLAVITQPDRPKGRGHNLQASPVKQKALEYNLPVLQPASSAPFSLLIIYFLYILNY